jgi:hypothetical protein
MKRSTAIFLVLALGSTWALATQTAAERQRAFARLPDWTGIWIVDDGIMTRLGLRNDVEGDPGPNFKDAIVFQNPPYNAEWRAKLQAAVQNAQSSRQSSKECGFYFPGVMESPWAFEVLNTPEQTVFIFAGREIRHIYTDGRSHPPSDELWPLPWGDSIGHWEGPTLVVDTISVEAHSVLFQLNPLFSPKAHFTERIRKVGKNRLEDVMTIVDPAALTRPWTFKLPYTRVTTLERLVHGDCMENDRNPVVDGKLTVAPPTE